MNLSIRPEQKTTEFSLVVLISFVCVCLLLLRADIFTMNEFEGNIKADHIYYVQLAVGGPQTCHEAPYCWRVLQPMLTSLLPFGVQANFLLITVISVWLTGIALYFLLRTYDVAPEFCLLGLLLFYSLGWATGFLFFYFWLGDGLGFLIITLAIYYIRVGNYACVLVLISLGTAAKEVVLAVVPLYYTLNVASRRFHDLFDLKLAGKTLVLALPAFGLLFLIRSTVPITNHYDITEWFAYLSAARAEGRVALPLVIAPDLQASLVSAFLFGNLATFGLVLFLPLFAPARNFKLLLRYAPFIALVNFQILVAEATERLLVYAFPVVILMSVFGLMSFAKRFSLSAEHLLPLVIALFILTLFGARWSWVFLNWQAVLFFVSIMLLLVAVMWRHRKAREQWTG